MFYTYRQNNSGGSLIEDADAGITLYVIIEADTAIAADGKAVEIGLYFDGVEDGSDCDCCGDRWYAMYSPWSDRDADEVPSIYGEPVDAYVSRFSGKRTTVDAYVHYADGTVKAFDFNTEPKAIES